eukprot:jgi/Tetstr1/423756/TSEL_014387.t1
MEKGHMAPAQGSASRDSRQAAGEPRAERPDLLELAQSGRVGAKSVSAEDDYLAVPELLQRAESGYEAVRPVSRVPGLFPLSTDLTNEYLKQDDRRLPAQEEYLWMSCFGAHMAALFVALDELLPYVPATNQDFTPYLARARNHAEAIDKAFRFRLAFLRRLNEIKRRLQLQVAGVGEDVAADVDVAAKDAFGSDELGQRTLDLLSSSLSAQTLKSYAGKLSQFAEFCHDSENISPLEATTATVVRYVAWIGERGHIAAKSLQPYLSAINTFFELHNLVPIAKDSLHLTSARQSHLDYRALLASIVNFLFFARGLTGVSCRVQDVHVDTYNITLQIYREKGRAGRRGPGDLRVLLLPVSEHPRVARLLHYFIDNVQSVPLVTVGLAASNFWAVNVAEESKPWTAATIIGPRAEEADRSLAAARYEAAPTLLAVWPSPVLQLGAVGTTGEHDKENNAWQPTAAAASPVRPGQVSVSGVSSPGRATSAPLTSKASSGPSLQESTWQARVDDGSLRLEEAQKQLAEAEEAVAAARVAQAERLELEAQLAQVMEALALARDRKEEAEEQLLRSRDQLEGMQQSKEEVSSRLVQEQAKHRELRASVEAMRSSLHPPAGGSPSGSRRPCLQEQLAAVKEAMLSGGGATPEAEADRPGQEAEAEAFVTPGDGMGAYEAEAFLTPAPCESPPLLAELLVSPSPLQPYRVQERSRIWDALDAAEQDVEGLTGTIKGLLAQLQIKRANVAASLDSLPTLVSPLKLLAAAEAQQNGRPVDEGFTFAKTVEPQDVAALRLELQQARSHAAELEGIVSAALSKVSRTGRLPPSGAMPGPDAAQWQAEWRRAAKAELERVARRLGDRERRVSALKCEVQREKSANRLGAEAIKQAKSHLASMHGHLMESPMRNANSGELRRLQGEVEELKRRAAEAEAERIAALMRAEDAEEELAALQERHVALQRAVSPDVASGEEEEDGADGCQQASPGTPLRLAPANHENAVSAPVERGDTPGHSPAGQRASGGRADDLRCRLEEALRQQEAAAADAPGGTVSSRVGDSLGALRQQLLDAWHGTEASVDAWAAEGRLGALLAGGGGVLLLGWYLARQRARRPAGGRGQAGDGMLRAMRALQLEL